MIYISTTFDGDKPSTMGLVHRSGNTFYAEIVDASEAVEGTEKMTREQCKVKLMEWLHSNDGPSQLWSVSPSTDYRFFYFLLGEDWPRKILNYLEDCRQHRQLPTEQIEAIKAKFRQDHALDMALQLKAIMNATYPK